MVIIQSPSEIPNYIDKPLTPSDWYHVTQEKINKFADATSDHQWIHVDEERAKKEMPDGKTIESKQQTGRPQADGTDDAREPMRTDTRRGQDANGHEDGNGHARADC